MVDRYTLRIRFGHPSPRFPLKLAESIYAGAIAREVAEMYGDAIMEHPVGTGPYRLVQWRRSSFIALERNPRFRDEFYDEQPAADDADGQAIAARLHGPARADDRPRGGVHHRGAAAARGWPSSAARST